MSGTWYVGESQIQDLKAQLKQIVKQTESC